MANTNAPIEDLKNALQEFVEAAAAELKDGVAYLLNKVDDGFYVPVACSKTNVFETARYYLLFSKPPDHKVKNGTCYPISDNVPGWLEAGRIEAIVFANKTDPIYQQFTPLADKNGNSLLLVRSNCSHPVPALAAETRRLCNPLLSLVFSRWASTSYEELLSSIDHGKGTIELANVMDSLVQVLDDRNPFPPYWPFSYFSLKVELGDLKPPPRIRTNALGLSRWSLKQLAPQEQSPLKPWIARMATTTQPEWEDIQAVAQTRQDYKEAVKQGGATAEVLVERLKDWIVPVCGFEEWKFYARHNKRKECKRGCPLVSQDDPPNSARAAVARILKHSAQTCEAGDKDETGDFLVTLWTLKVGEKNNVIEAIPIGGRVAEDFSYLIEDVHLTLPGEHKDNDTRSKIEIRYAPIPGHKTETTDENLKKLTIQALAALQNVDPQAHLKQSLSKIFELHKKWNDFFPSEVNSNVPQNRFHWPVKWKEKPEHSDFLLLKAAVVQSLETLAPVLRIPKGDLPDQNDAQHNNWFLHIAKAINHKRVSPELLSLVAGKVGFSSSRAYEIVGITDNPWNDTSLELASDLLYGCALLSRPDADAMNLVECYIREDTSSSVSKQTLLVIRFESIFKPTYEISHSVAQAFQPPGSWHAGDELRRGCSLLRKHALAQKTGITQRECMKYTVLFEFKVRDIEGESGK